MSRTSVTMNGQPGGESELVWERPWSMEEMRRASVGWSLGADAGLLLFLQDFSQRMLSRTHEIEHQLDSLIQNTKATDSRLHSVFNDFLMLSNTQFIENRVYDDEVEEATPKTETGGRPAEPEKTREQKEAELIPKVQEAVRFGLRVLDSAFEQLDITAGNSDSEDEENGESAEPLLEPKDLYIDRPLPYLIGSQQFLEEEDVGLGDLSSEGSAGSDGRSVIESEEEKEPKESDDDFVDESEEDEKKPMKSSHLSGDEEEEGDEDDEDSDLFHESEKEEDEDQEAPGVLRSAGPTSFVDELAARIQGDGTQQAGLEKTVSRTAEPAAKKREKTKKEVQKKREDEEDLFPAPRDDDVDEGDTYSPFGGRSGLFSGGRGLFDDEGEGDLFAEALKEEPKPKAVAVPEPAVTKSGKKVPVGAVSLYPGVDLFGGSVVAEPSRRKEIQKERRPAETVNTAIAGGLFDDDDEDDLFGSGLKPSKSGKLSGAQAPPKPRTAAVLFEDSEDSGLFEPAVTPKPGKDKPNREAKNVDEQPGAPDDSPPLAEKSQTSSGLFSDEEESQDLFSTNSDSKGNQAKFQASVPASQNLVSLFDDEDEHVPPKKPMSASAPKSEPKSSGLFDEEKQGGWNSSKQRKPTQKPAPSSRGGKPSPDRQTTVKSGQASPAHKKLSLFDNNLENENDEDLFGVPRRESQKKSHKVLLLFEEDDDLFGPPRSASKSMSPPQVSGIFGENEEKDFVDQTERKEQTTQQVDSNKQRPVGGVPLFPGIDILEQKKQGSKKREPVEPELSPSRFAEDVKSGMSSVVSLFDEEEDVSQEDGLSSSSQASGELLSDTGVSTRVFQDEELLFSHHQQLDNDPDVDLFADALKPESAKASMVGAREDEKDKPNFSSVAVKPPPVHKREAKQVGDWTSPEITAATTPGPSTEHPRGHMPESERLSGPHCTKTKAPSSRIGKLQANLAFNPATLLPGASPRISASQGSPSPSSPPGQLGTSMPSQEVGVDFDEPVQADTLHCVVKSRVRIAGKRRPPTRGAHRQTSWKSDELEETDQGSKITAKAPVETHIPSPLGKQTPSEVVGIPKWAPAAKADPLLGARARPTTPPDALFNSDHLFSPSACQETAGPREGTATEWQAEKGPSMPTLAQDQGLYQPERPASKKLKPTPLLEEKEEQEEADDLFGTAKRKSGRKQPTATTHRESKVQDIFEDDLFATESVAVTKRSNAKSGASSLFGDGEDIFADLSAVKPKEKRTKKKVETKSIFDDDMDDIFASASVKKPLSSKPRASQPAGTTGAPNSKTPNVFDDPLNVLGGQ